MDFFFCLPILFGCPKKIKPEGDPQPRHCPRCNNTAVMSASSRTYFEVCFVPLFPISKKHIWICGICSWQVPQGGPEPNYGPSPGYGPAPGYGPPQPSYSGAVYQQPGFTAYQQPAYGHPQAPYAPAYIVPDGKAGQ